MKLSGKYNLKSANPVLASQWHPFKNGSITPDKVAPAGGKKVWWLCDFGHEWKAALFSRNSGIGCPMCGSIIATKKHNLLITHPDIAEMWHPTKNGDITPGKVTQNSRKKVWWICNKGHEWQDVIRARTRYGNACPFCFGIDGCKEYNLSELHPDIAGQWHPKKNGLLKPEDVTPGSNKKVWWLCEKGHEWQAHIASRRCRGCPYCAGQKASENYNLRAVRPTIAGQWHPTKNKLLKPEDVTPGSNKKVWWLCEKGHEWQANIASRRYGRGCPYCAGQKASENYNLLIINPGLAGLWHPKKNGLLKPEDVTPGSDKKVWWLCEKGHEWQATIIDRNMGNSCPYCAGKKASENYNLLIINPGLAGQWHPKKNGLLKPEYVTPGSNKKVWWLCEKGHEWQANINYRNRGNGCPYCAGKKASESYNLRAVNPTIAGQWHPTKNGKLNPEHVTPGSGRKVWWLCEKGHEWQAGIEKRSNGGACPYCAGKKASREYNLLIIKPDIAGQWHPFKNGSITPGKVTPGSRKKVWWLCDMDHEWQAEINSRSNGSGCPYCAGKRKSLNWGKK